MTLAFSTSSPLASVALFAEDGCLLYADEREARQDALGALVEMLDGIDGWRDATRYAADLGPGSFTGVRVGVTLAKTLAWTAGAVCLGADAFDLVDPNGPVALPSKKGEWFVRTPGLPLVRSTEPGIATDRRPRASGFGPLLVTLAPVDPLLFAPRYLLDPSISTPKKPYAARV